ncbi:MOSC domain-containing protein [Nocardioides sp. CFH 31398]|uniref:MOSC domain-containing protein n=1 Tax=Nocardioides sp. CFH 31398 TaxID=2919579 RepID=UPI001F053DBE|nr:MOSC N-terminal beta barrel domain-containing protein [Nocardioides sp. CFH 31398]MCH1867150.1 MOSC domain-containing protein [Nocardioides sp. CFH 31398]
MPLAVSALHRYPVKSCGGQDLDEARVEPWGLAGDHRWMVATATGLMVTARECPALLGVAVDVADDPRAPHPGTLTLRAPGREPFTVAVPDPAPAAEQRPVDLWGTASSGTDAGAEASAWLADLLDAEVGELLLLHLDDPARRPVDPRFAHEADRVSFADGYPLHLTTDRSLTALNNLVDDGPRADEGPLPMSRFRPNLVVSGAEAWEEDTWRRIRVGTGQDAVEFRLPKGCARCVMTTTDPATGESGREPLATLVRHRRWDGQSWFGMNLLPDGPGVVRVGDPVEVLEVDDSGSGPPRASTR